MKIEEFEKVFNSVKHGDFVTKNKLKQATTPEEKEFFKAIKKSGKRHSHEGASKECTFFGKKGIEFALLKHKSTKAVKCGAQFDEDEVVRFNHWLISKGVNTPRLYTMFFADGNYFEVHEKAKGQESALVGYDNIISLALGGGSNTNTTIINPTPLQKFAIGSYLYKFNLRTQKMLLNMPQEKFDDLFRQYQFLNNMGFRQLDTNSGNLMVNPNGFTIIDLDLKKNLAEITNELSMINERKSNLDDLIEFSNQGNIFPNPYLIPNTSEEREDTLSADFLFPFCSTRFYKHFLTEKQYDTLYKNDIKILTKAVNAITNNNCTFYIDDGKARNQVLFCLNNKIDKYYQVCDSQVKLQQKRKIEEMLM